MSGYTVLHGDAHDFTPPSWNPAEPARRTVELRRHGLLHSQANMWLFPPGSANRRHREPVQEEVFCVLDGVLTAYLGEPPERIELPPRSVVVVEPRTPLQLRNESETDVVFFAYGAPHQPADYEAEKLEDAYFS
jgi:mannose-6-phosphate isomerase-like protein (cupin superfamily)